MFRTDYPVAWAFHTNTMRWPFNTLEPGENWPDGEFKEYRNKPSLALPAPAPIDTPLGQAIRSRLSCRAFTAGDLSLEQLSTLFSFGYGIEERVLLGPLEHLERPVPSGGGLYPLELYLIAQRVAGLEPGVYHYFPPDHSLDELERITIPHAVLTQLFMNQPYLADCAAVLVLTGDLARNMHKYADRGYRYILFEAGHVMQNVNLVAAALEIGAFNVGGFFDGYLANLLKIDLEKEIPLYGVALGVPATSDRVLTRNPGALFESSPL